MTEGINLDASQIGVLAADLARLPGLTRRNLRSAVTVTARKTKDAWNGKLYTEGHAARTGHAIDYDVTDLDAFGVTVLQAEIGAKRGTGRQAGIVRLLENGSVHNPPHGYGAAALQQNEADFEHGLDLALHAAEKEAGLP
jgi:hypothetical protein